PGTGQGVPAHGARRRYRLRPAALPQPRHRPALPRPAADALPRPAAGARAHRRARRRSAAGRAVRGHRQGPARPPRLRGGRLHRRAGPRIRRTLGARTRRPGRARRPSRRGRAHAIGLPSGAPVPGRPGPVRRDLRRPGRRVADDRAAIGHAVPRPAGRRLHRPVHAPIRARPGRPGRRAQAVLDRHANLRVAFAETADGTTVQVVPARVEAPWRQIALDHLDPAVIAAEAERIENAELAQHFDPRTAPLLRFTLLRTSPERYHLVVTSHHILIDGWSVPLLLRELLTGYAFGPHSRELPPVRPYRDYLTWLARQDREAALAA